MRFGTKHQWGLYLFVLGTGAVTGTLLGAIVGPGLLSPAWFGAMIAACVGCIDMTISASLIGAVEIFFFRTRAGRTIDRAPFWTLYFLKLVSYSLIIFCVSSVKIGEKVVENLILVPYIYKTNLLHQIKPHVKAALPVEVMVGYGVIVLVLFILIIQLSRLVGEQSVRDIALGRYHRARREERFFLFIDIVGSTPLAERIGPEFVHRFLDRVFQIASDPIDNCGGDVYQYVGDEIVITWLVTEGRSEARPLACLLAIDAALSQASAEFEREFGTAPKLRAALHAGEVVTGEIGGSRRAIVFHGDVMNTTSRIENATRDLGRPFLVSEDALNQLSGAKEICVLEDLGPRQLRGRTATIRLYAVAPK